MKSAFNFLFAASAALVLPCLSAKAVLITDFGTGQFTMTFADFPTTAQTATTFQVIGTDANSLYGEITPQVLTSTSWVTLDLAGTFVGTANGNFQIQLFDAEGDDRLYQGTWSQFTPSVPTTISLTFVSQTGAFDGNVVSIGLLGAGGGTGTVNVTLDSLSAVPEPTSLALLACGTVGVLVLRRRRTV